jgi:hypothetical protein
MVGAVSRGVLLNWTVLTEVPLVDSSGHVPHAPGPDILERARDAMM